MSVKILLDQNVPRQLCDYLRGKRPEWKTRHVGDVGLWGASDSEILEWARRECCVIVTYDEDFADTRMFPVGSHAGVIRL